MKIEEEDIRFLTYRDQECVSCDQESQDPHKNAIKSQLKNEKTFFDSESQDTFIKLLLLQQRVGVAFMSSSQEIICLIKCMLRAGLVTQRPTSDPLSIIEKIVTLHSFMLFCKTCDFLRIFFCEEKREYLLFSFRQVQNFILRSLIYMCSASWLELHLPTKHI